MSAKAREWPSQFRTMPSRIESGTSISEVRNNARPSCGDIRSRAVPEERAVVLDIDEGRARRDHAQRRMGRGGEEAQELANMLADKAPVEIAGSMLNGFE